MEYRNTRQRKELLDFLEVSKNHPTAYELYVHQKEVFENISMSTVYRNLQVLVEQGLIKKLEIDGRESHYDAMLDYHAHMICEKCEKIIDIYDDDFDETPYKIQNFKISHVSKKIYGICDKCQKENE